MKKTLLVATALTTSAYTFSSVAAQPSSSVLQSLPAEVRKDIEETRTSCKSSGNELSVTAGDIGLIQFLLGSRKAVLVDPIILCGGCYPGFHCSNRGTREVRVYALFGKAWRMVLSNDFITGDIFVSNVPGNYSPEGQELNALVVNLFIGNKECPTRRAPDNSSQSWEARSCVVRWNGTKFTYKPL
jgi:hypothetical protein